MEQVVYLIPGASAAVGRAGQEALEAAAHHASPLLARTVAFEVQTDVARALQRLHAHATFAFVIDTRRSMSEGGQMAAAQLLGQLFEEHDIRGPVAREQTWVVVDADAPGAQLAFEAGRARIAGTIVVGADDSAPGALWSHLEGALRYRRQGRVALCLAGGGIEGLFYELGVMRALQYFMPDFPLSNVDIVCGISAGAILGAFLVNGVGPDEIIRGFQFGGDRVDKITRHQIFDPNVGEVLQRLGRATLSMLRGKSTPLQALFRLAPSGLFAGERLGAYLQRQFTKPGMVNRFTETQRRLFIGATDQDTAEHVVFGSPGWDHVPIHLAARASAALTPFYAPQCIDGRYYMDGSFTRTTNMRIAVEYGATLVVLIDPLVPILSPRPGYVASKGMMLVGMQGLKSLIHGRFDRAVYALRAMYPQIAFHLFQPDGATMRVMSGSPMKYFYRTEIEEIAFRETIRSIRQSRFERLQGDFERHSILFVDPESDVGAIKRDLLDEASEVQVA